MTDLTESQLDRARAAAYDDGYIEGWRDAMVAVTRTVDGAHVDLKRQLAYVLGVVAENSSGPVGRAPTVRNHRAGGQNENP